MSSYFSGAVDLVLTSLCEAQELMGRFSTAFKAFTLTMNIKEDLNCTPTYVNVEISTWCSATPLAHICTNYC